MRPRFTRIPRRAWLASLAVHAAVAVGVFLLVPLAPPKPVAVSAKIEPLQLSLATPDDEPPAEVVIPLPQPAPRVAPALVPPPPLAPGRVPTVTAIPAAIPSDFRDRIRDLAARPMPTVAATDFPLPALPSDIRPAEYVAPRPAEPATPAPTPPPKFAGGTPIHGPLPADTVAVYLLDCSASMGLNRDTFDAARTALVATVATAPRGAKFQVFVYAGEVVPLLRDPAKKLLTAGDDTSRKVLVAVAELKCEGRSAHDAALRAAAGAGADYVVWITDATDAELAKSVRVLKAAAKPVAVYVARAANGAVAEPAALRE